VLDPFTDENTLIVRCDILEPSTMQGYERDPRSVAKRAEAYLKSTGIADTAFFGPEPEFFVLDDVRWGADMSGAFYKVDSDEADWNSERVFEDGNIGHRPGVKGGYFPVPPVDSLHDLRAAMCLAMEEMGVPVEVHHHEVATAGQCEIGTKFTTLVQRADWNQILKYCTTTSRTPTARRRPSCPSRWSATTAPACTSTSPWPRTAKNIFAGDKYGGLSETALYYIGGIIKHARALNAFTNASTNSYKRLVPGFEAPVMLAYSARNRSASIRIPHDANPKGDPHRGALPGSDRQPLPGVLGDDDGRPRRHPEQDPSRRRHGQGSLRPAARRGRRPSRRSATRSIRPWTRSIRIASSSPPAASSPTTSSTATSRSR
jgi:glutamine synthetase